MTNVVVTGGYGFIGSLLVSTLLARADSVTVFDLAKNGRDSGIEFDRHANFRFVQGDVADMARYGGRYEDIPRRIPDSTKAQRELGWRVQVDLEEGIRRTIDWARANPWYLNGPAGDKP